MLSGAYNSNLGIPSNWQVFLSATNLPLWGQNSYSQILKLANDLLATWSGAHCITPHTNHLTKEKIDLDWELDPISIVAAPNIIRPR